MKYFAGLDVSLEETSVCVVDERGEVVSEAKVASEAEAIACYLSSRGVELTRVGLEAGPLSSWLHTGLVDAGLPALCIETRRAKAALSAMINKTDRNDARGIAQIMRTGWYRAVHVKTRRSQELRMLLGMRRLLLNKLCDVQSGIRGSLRSFGLKLGKVGRRGFEARVRELLADEPVLGAIVEPLLKVRAVLQSEHETLDKMMLRAVRDDAVCRRLMTVPGVGPVTALTFRATVDVPARFAKSRSVGAHFGLTPRRFQSGEVDRNGRITKCGDALARYALYEAANVLLSRVTRPSALKAWALRVAKLHGRKKAKVALARRLAVILHRMWMDGSEFRWSDKPEGAAV